MPLKDAENNPAVYDMGHRTKLELQMYVRVPDACFPCMGPAVAICGKQKLPTLRGRGTEYVLRCGKPLDGTGHEPPRPLSQW